MGAKSYDAQAAAARSAAGYPGFEAQPPRRSTDYIVQSGGLSPDLFRVEGFEPESSAGIGNTILGAAMVAAAALIGLAVLRR